MDIGFKYVSEYDYETSEEETISFLGTISWGTIVLNRRSDDSKLRIKYRCVSLGSGKSFPLNATKSTFDSVSGGDAVVTNRYFSELCFPCKGYMIGVGAGISNSNAATMVLFGVVPVFAGVRMWGISDALLPGVGIGAGLASFWVE